jgi:uroporphyrin-III C-methyltransferase
MNCLLKAGCEPERPAAIIASGTYSSQRTVTGTVGTMAQLVARDAVQSPAVIVVGPVVRLHERLKWYATSVRPEAANCVVDHIENFEPGGEFAQQAGT